MASGLGLASLDPHTHFDLGDFTGDLSLIAVVCACCNVYASRAPTLKPVLEKLLGCHAHASSQDAPGFLRLTYPPVPAGFSGLPFGIAPRAANLVMPFRSPTLGTPIWRGPQTAPVYSCRLTRTVRVP